MSSVPDISSDDFASKVLEGSKTQPVIVDFWAEWCAPCKAMESMYEETVKEFQGRAMFYKLNVDEYPALSQQYGVMSIPTVIYFKDGKPSAQSIGLIDKSELAAHIEKLLS